jgi:phage-related protein
MTDTFTPSVAPAPGGSSVSDVDRIRNAPFGDGYSQRAPDGLNYKDRTASLTWPSLNPTKFAEINGFFDAHGGGVAFIYTLPLEATAMKWMWTSKTPSYVGGPTANAVRSLRVELKRVFDL